MEKYTYSGMKMCELGNQKLRKNKFKTGKEYFESKNIIHTSIDINGLDGALPIDLSEPIPYPKLLHKFDIVTNLGTSEHVEDQYWCFWNIHNLCNIGGIMLHIVPRPKYWRNHGYYKYEFEFFEELSKHNGYKLIEVNRSLYSMNRKKRKKYLCSVVMKKYEDKLFMGREEFYKLGGLYNE